MLAKHMFGYAPSLIIPGLLSFVSVYCFTRLMDPNGYGHYVLAINAMTMLLGVGFFWLQSAASRLLPRAVEQRQETRFTATLYVLYALCGLGLMLVAAALIALFPLGDWRTAAWFAPPLAIIRALLNLNQAQHRTFVHIARYNIIEVGQSIIGLGAALFLIISLHEGATGAALGMMIGLVVMACFDWRLLGKMHPRNFDRAWLRDIMHFGLPFIINYGLSFIVARSDSFLIQIFRGSAEVGIYNAGYAFPDRIGQYIFMAVATASLPLTVRIFEKDGVHAARQQTYTNGIAVLAMSVPLCIGMLFANHQIVAVLIGEDFRAGAVQVMPWITVAMILNGLAAHYFDHAFHLAKKTKLFFYTLGPAALLNLGGNLLLIPRYGYIGAAWTTVASYALYLTLSICVGRRAFAVRFPFKPAFDIVLATLFMALMLSPFTFSETLGGLVAMTALGAASYGTGMLVLDVMGIRSFVVARLRRPSATQFVTSDLVFTVLRTPAEIETVAPEWQALYERAARGIFGSYDWHQIWWRCLGQNTGETLHIITARASSGTLQGILPLTVQKKTVLRIAGWAGYGTFDYSDVLASDEATANALWVFACKQSAYDIALIKDVQADALSLPLLSGRMRLRKQKKNYFLTLDQYASGEAWLAGQSRKLRGDTRRKREKMQAQGAVSAHAYRPGDVVPAAVIDALYDQKSAWFVAHNARGIFSQTGTKTFLHELAQDAARRRMLYLAWLSCGDAIVACHMGFVRDGVLYLYHTTYDASYGAFSPGNLMMGETIKAAIDAGLKRMDFMRGEESYKVRFATGSRVLGDYVTGCTLLGRLTVALQPAEKTEEKTSESSADPE